ncbi:MAG: hypothetical protein HY076_08295 [Candidatus Eisenbacteria bacterium]|uniref:T9SS type A sorting domain-containing protein n=1 Tax=Eiseniibacteriota bacterium TaxID=2212470 RepID=A0A9D6L7X4_UNCEI|nr:hypothetical protein [Candidatus Eisenbacteria bacterium]
MVEACTDGAHGTFVAWQEETSAGVGVLRVQHLLVSGDLDPAWPTAGAVAVATSAARTELFALPDRLGGLYLFWQEGGTLQALRMDGTGAVATGWPSQPVGGVRRTTGAAGGRVLGSISNYSQRASLIEDGSHGFYGAWMNDAGALMAIHLGPSNTGAGGWPNGPLQLADSDHRVNLWPHVALAPDGGAFLAWATWSTNGNTSSGSWLLHRLTPAGIDTSGWPPSGLSFGDFHLEYLNLATHASLLDLAVDGRGGAFLLIANPVSAATYYATLETRLYRVQGSGIPAVGWPAAGRVDPYAQTVLPTDGYGPSPDASFRLLYDDRDGALVGSFTSTADTPIGMSFDDLNSAGARMTGIGAWVANGYELVSGGGGEVFLAEFNPKGPYQPYEPNAYLRVKDASTTLYSEYQSQIVVTFYGDIGLASTEDGGAVFVWSQVRDRVGLIARKFSRFGEVTGVAPPASGPPGLHQLRFERGVGVRASITAPDGGRLDLFDIAGRRIATVAIGAGDRDATIPGTGAIAPGLYFGRLVAGAARFTGKVLVTR